MDLTEFGFLEFSRTLVYLSWALYLGAIVFSVAAQSVQDRRLVHSARQCMLFGALTLVGASAGLIAGFVLGAYEVGYIFNYSESGLPLRYKIAGLWAGLEGSILFWSMLVGVLAAFVTLRFRRDDRHPVARRLEPNVYLVFGIVQLFFVTVIAFVENPFATHLEELGALEFGHRFPEGNPSEGAGLNPLLVNYWMQIHPPSLYLGWVTYTVPFAYGVAALITGEQGNYWIRMVRRWMLVGWLFNTTGIVLGGLWAYEVLGWGGYWAWDPVENASFLPWLTATAFLHSSMIQERRGMLKGWTNFLVVLTFFFSLFGTYLTRSGIVDSVHAFASGEVGNWFFAFLMFITFGSIFLLALRHREFRSPHKIESVMSREAIFVLNNMILVAIAAAIAVLTLWPKISNDWLGQPVTVSVPYYNLVTVPFFALLLFFTAVGPGMAWVSTSKRRLVQNFGLASVLAVPVAAGIQYAAHRIKDGETGHLSWLEQLYPTFVLNYFSCLIITCLSLEVYRTVRNRSQRTGRSALVVLGEVFERNNRRYGGYLVHVGLAALAIGVVNSSMFKVIKDLNLREGDTVKVGRYDVTLTGTRHDPQSEVYIVDHLDLELTENGKRVARLEPELRLYPRTRYRPNPQTTTEVDIYRGLTEDFYVYFKETGEDGEYRLVFYRNPLVNLVWAGWLMMLAGGIYAAVPLGRRRVGLAG